MRLSDVEDSWGWRPEDGSEFSVKPAYFLLEDLVFLDPRFGGAEEGVFASLWKIPAPLEVIAFFLKLLRDHIPSSVNLAKRNVLDPESPTRCVFSDNAEETSLQLWSKVWNWPGISLTTLQNLFI